jgi:hypothetical protein
MKQFSTIILLSIITSYCTQAQSESYIYYKDKLPTRDSLIYTSEVIAVDSTKAQDLYFRSKNWFYDSFKSGRAVIKLDIESNNEISGRGFFEAELIMTRPGQGRTEIQPKKIYFTVKIQCKDNRYRYELSNFRTINQSVAAYQTPTETRLETMRPHVIVKALGENNFDFDLEKYYGQIAIQVNSITNSFKKAMQTKSEW